MLVRAAGMLDTLQKYRDETYEMAYQTGQVPEIALNSVLEKYEFTGSRVSYVRFVSSYSFFQQKPQKHIEEYGVLMST